MLRDMESSSQQTLVCGSVCVGQRVAVIGGEEIVCDALCREVEGGEEMPCPLAPSSLEVVWSAVTPYLDGIEGRINGERSKEAEKRVENEEEIMLVGVRAVAEVVDILRASLTVLHELEHEDEVLHIHDPIVC